MKGHVFCSRFLLLLSVCAETSSAQTPRWRTLPNAPFRADRHEDVFFIDQYLGWVVNRGGQIYATTNGGGSWQLQFTAPAYCRSVGFADAYLGWVGTLDSTHVLYQTTNGGSSWLEVSNLPLPRPRGICGISVVNNSVMYASGRYNGPARMIKTINGGASWTSIDLAAYAGTLVDCYFFSPDSGFVVGSTNPKYWLGFTRVLFTSDGGSTWTIRYAGNRAGELCWKILFRTRMIGYISIEGFQSGPTYYLRTTDGGVTWSDSFFLNPLFDVQGIGFLGDSRGWIGGWGGDTYETTDAGASWHLAGFGYNVNRFRFLSDTLAYAVGQTVYRYSIDSLLLGVGAKPQLPSAFHLLQNYPNPFNPETKIEFRIPEVSLVLLRIYDILGVEVATLVNERKTPGTYTATWNARGFPSGVYFCRLNTGDFVQAKKMLLIK